MTDIEAREVIHIGHETRESLTPAQLEGLLSIEDAGRRTHLSVERLGELCDARYAPHYRIDGRVLFRKTEIQRWVAENIAVVSEGIPMPRALPVFPERRAPTGPPREIVGIQGLRALDLAPHPGVYFLAHRGEVVYVGKSVCVMARVGQHLSEGRKDFDAAYFVAVPRPELNDIERRFIRDLGPRYNGNSNGGGMR